MTLSKDQLNAKQTILDWINSRNRRSFITLGGYAGTGKSSLIAEVRKALPRNWKVAFCAYTGKASGVMKDKLIAANAVNFNIDPTRLGVIGYSAGANRAGVIARSMVL